MIIYADILFLVNLSLNWFSLILTSKMMKLKSGTPKLLLSASIGALIGTFTVFFKNNLAIALSEIASTFLMCTVAFKAYSTREYVKICACLFASGATLGTSLTLVYSFLGRSDINLYSHSDASSAVFILLSFALTASALIFKRLLSSGKKANCGKVLIEYNKKSITIPFFSDSGNFLRDPISYKPAIIVEKNCISEVFPFSIDGESSLLNSNNIPKTLHKRIRLLPTKTISGDLLMLGFIPDKITLITENSKKDVDAIIAVSNSDFSRSEKGMAIVPSVIT